MQDILSQNQPFGQIPDQDPLTEFDPPEQPEPYMAYKYLTLKTIEANTQLNKVWNSLLSSIGGTDDLA